MTLNGNGVGGVKVKLIAKVKLKGDNRWSASTSTSGGRRCSVPSA